VFRALNEPGSADEMKNYLNKKSHRTDVRWLKSLTKGMMKWSKIRLPDAAESSGS
jgi:hypothetical protein